jgi:hypothetical protein
MLSSGNIKFKIYLHRFGRLVQLYFQNRNKNGRFMFDSRIANHTSFHEGGRYWMSYGNSKLIKKLRQPLSSFKGQETLSGSVFTILAPKPRDVEEESCRLKSEDYVIDFDVKFGI